MLEEGGAIRLFRQLPSPQLVRSRTGLLVARPTVRRADLPKIDVAALIDRERHHDE